METVRWRLKEFLEQHDLTAYALTRAAELAPNTVYTITRGRNQQVKLETLAGILGGLQKLTGEAVGFDDILEYHSEGRAAQRPNVPEPAWLKLGGVLDEPGGPDYLSADAERALDAALLAEHDASASGDK